MTAESHQTKVGAAESRRWAAEETALELGWIRECPFHGEPFRSAGYVPAAGANAVPATAPELGEDLALLALQISSAYADECPLCARENSDPV